MSDENQQPNQEPSQASQSTAPPGKQAPADVPYDRFKEVNDKAKSLEARLAELEAAQKTAQEAEMAKNAEWQKLADQYKNELDSERLARQRLQVANEKGLPAKLAERLAGGTLEEMQADADGLLELIAKPNRAPGAPPSTPKTPNQLDLSTMTPSQIRENASKIMGWT